MAGPIWTAQGLARFAVKVKKLSVSKQNCVSHKCVTNWQIQEPDNTAECYLNVKYYYVPNLQI